MGMDLHNTRNNYFYVNIFNWERILDLAREYGWEPMGTEKPPDWEETDDSWDGDYLTNGGQIVKNEDAQSIADALELALCHLRSYSDPVESIERQTKEITDDPLIKSLVKSFGRIESDIEQRVLAASKSSKEFVHGKEECLVRPFINFCREGSFCIW